MSSNWKISVTYYENGEAFAGEWEAPWEVARCDEAWLSLVNKKTGESFAIPTHNVGSLSYAVLDEP